MKVKIEFIKSRSPAFSRSLSICRAIPSFTERESDGMTIYSIEFSDNEFVGAHAVYDLVGRWKGTAFYRDGALISRAEFVRTVFYDTIRASIENQELTRRFGSTPSEFIKKQHP